MTDKVSVIVPIYNVSKYLKKCIESICVQTYSDLEIILVNDGSEDESENICKEYQQKDKRIIVLNKIHGGLVSARKYGLRMASAEYVMYVDGDDWIEPDWIQHILEEMRQNDVDIVCAGHLNDYGDCTTETHNIIQSGVYNRDQIIDGMLCNDVFFSMNITPYLWSKIFKREILEKVQMNVDEIISLGEDVAVTYNAILHCEKIYISKLVGYHYVQRTSSISNISYENELERVRALVKYLNKTLLSDLQYKEICGKQIKAYEKLLFLTRLPKQLDAFFLQERNNCILKEFGGIHKDEKVLLYGAGNFGKIIWRYLQGFENIKVLQWVDKQFLLYQKLGLSIDNPENFDYSSDKYDSIIIAVSNTDTQDKIKKWLVDNGANPHKCRVLCEDFLKYFEDKHN